MEGICGVSRVLRYMPIAAALAVLYGMLAASPRAETAELVPIDGQPFDAELLSVDANWHIGFKTVEGTRAMPAADVVRWGALQELRRGPVLVLADGGLLVADGIHADKETLTAESLLFGKVHTSLERLNGVVFQLPGDRDQRDRLLDIIASPGGSADQVILSNGDRVIGRLQGIQDMKLRMETTIGPIDVERNRVRALAFNPGLVRRAAGADPRALVGLRDGSRLMTGKLELDGPSARITVAEELLGSTARDELVFLQPLGGKATYLSDLKAADYRHVPFLELNWPYRLDHSVTGTWLRASGRLYWKGLGLHSASRLTYQLTEPYRRLDAQLAVDQSAGGLGSFRLRVFVDGVLKYTSPTVRGGTAPIPVSVDLADARRLDLVVDFADRADVLDRADLLEARLVR